MLTGIPRRRLFQGGLALVVAGGALGWFKGGYRLLPGEAAIGLSVKGFCIVRAVVLALLPEADGMPSGVSLGVPQRIDEEVWAAEPGLQADLRTVIQLVEHAAPMFGGFGRLSALPPDEARRVLTAMATSRVDALAQGVMALRQLCHLFYFTHPDVWPHIGYDGPWIREAKPPPSALAYAALRGRS